MPRVLTGKGNESVVAHIGNEEEFATKNLLLFQSKLEGSYHIQWIVRYLGNIFLRKFT
jgi:hypothetical protein